MFEGGCRVCSVDLPKPQINEQEFRDLVAVYRQIASQVAELEERQRAVNAIINGYLRLLPELRGILNESPNERGNGSPADEGISKAGTTLRGKAAVESILRGQPGRRLSVSEIANEMVARGWIHERESYNAKVNPVRIAVERMAGDARTGVRRHKEAGGSVKYCYEPAAEVAPG
jgi:hypothetical protein